MSERERRTRNPMAIQLAEALARAQQKVVPNGPESTALDILRKEVLGNSEPVAQDEAPAAPAVNGRAPAKLGRPKEATRMWLETSKKGDQFVDLRGKLPATLYLLAARAGRKISIEEQLLVSQGKNPVTRRVKVLTVTGTCEPKVRHSNSEPDGEPDGE